MPLPPESTDSYNRPQILVVGGPSLRNPHLLPALSGLGPVRVIDAIFPSAETKRQLGVWDNVTQAGLGRPYLPGELGCFLAHQSALRAATEHPGPTLIVEDDAEVHCLRGVAEALDAPELTTDVVILHRHPPALAMRSRRRGHLKARRLVGQPYGTVAYIVSAGVAKRLVSRNSDVPTLADWPSPGRPLGVGFSHMFCSCADTLVGEMPASISAVGNRGAVSWRRTLIGVVALWTNKNSHPYRRAATHSGCRTRFATRTLRRCGACVRD